MAASTKNNYCDIIRILTKLPIIKSWSLYIQGETDSKSAGYVGSDDDSDDDYGNNVKQEDADDEEGRKGLCNI